ncbi:MAG: saccharopine dehydrogenase NADP-binding domain-containing protein [Planctomycetia bacterium]|nr:saccharopine dehydrogenase NADP-binding domain-containing protein [Planctomycetia bacterium]
MNHFLIYGATGYSGALIARVAVRRGLQPILAGRNRAAVVALADELHLQARVFALDQPSDLDAGLQGVKAVLHCAGPFAHTYRAMADACLRTRTHYLDITGEIAVFEGLAARDAEAQAAGVMLQPGVGFDVVPSDCLAAHLKRRLPTATHLALGMHTVGGLSRGTATTIAENLQRGGAVRRDGRIVPVPAAYRTRVIDFGDGPRKAITIPWGDVSTAYHSTGIPNVEVYMAAGWGQRVAARLSRYARPLLGSAWMQARLKQRIRNGPPGPSPEQRANGKTCLWGEATDIAGRRVVSRQFGPEGYTLTALAALLVVERVLAGEAPPGFQTPAKAYGPDLVLAIPDVRREDEDARD